jgi:hypothetical protein
MWSDMVTSLHFATHRAANKKLAGKARTSINSNDLLIERETHPFQVHPDGPVAIATGHRQPDSENKSINLLTKFNNCLKYSFFCFFYLTRFGLYAQARKLF